MYIFIYMCVYIYSIRNAMWNIEILFPLEYCQLHYHRREYVTCEDLANDNACYVLSRNRLRIQSLWYFCRDAKLVSVSNSVQTIDEMKRSMWTRLFFTDFFPSLSNSFYSIPRSIVVAREHEWRGGEIYLDVIGRKDWMRDHFCELGVKTTWAKIEENRKISLWKVNVFHF